MPNKFIPPQTTTTTRTAATPIDGEILYDTDEKKLYYGDGTTVGGKAIGSPTVTDNVFRIQDNTDSTKQLAFETSGITTGTTRTLTVPDSNGTLLSTDTLTDKALYYYDASSKLFKPVGIGTLDQVLVAKPSSNPPYQWATPTTREVLTSNRTYYIRTDGNDSNNGLTDATGGAFLTPQKAFDVADTIIKNGYKITIQLANGTYSITSSIKIKGDDIGDIELVGNPTTPSNVVIQSNSSINLFEKVNVGNIEIDGIKVQSNGDTPNLVCFNVSNGILKYKNIDFGTTTTGTLGAGNNAHFYVINRGGILATGNATITGNAAYHIFVFYDGIVLDDYLFNPSSPISSTLTLSGSREFVYFVRLLGGEYRQAASRRTISGSATGIRYSIGGGGRCITGGGANYFPGNSTVPVETASYSYYT